MPAIVAFLGDEWQLHAKRGTIHRIVLYVKSVSWGKGDKVHRIKLTKDRKLAVRMRTKTALAVARAYRDKVRFIEEA